MQCNAILRGVPCADCKDGSTTHVSIFYLMELSQYAMWLDYRYLCFGKMRTTVSVWKCRKKNVLMSIIGDTPPSVRRPPVEEEFKSSVLLVVVRSLFRRGGHLLFHRPLLNFRILLILRHPSLFIVSKYSSNRYSYNDHWHYEWKFLCQGFPTICLWRSCCHICQYRYSPNGFGKGTSFFLL